MIYASIMHRIPVDGVLIIFSGNIGVNRRTQRIRKALGLHCGLVIARNRTRAASGGPAVSAGHSSGSTVSILFKIVIGKGQVSAAVIGCHNCALVMSRNNVRSIIAIGNAGLYIACVTENSACQATATLRVDTSAIVAVRNGIGGVSAANLAYNTTGTASFMGFNNRAIIAAAVHRRTIGQEANHTTGFRAAVGINSYICVAVFNGASVRESHQTANKPASGYRAAGNRQMLHRCIF